MRTERDNERLPQSLDALRKDDSPSIYTLATGIDRDRDARHRQPRSSLEFRGR